MADSANTCPICNKPLSNGHCDECGYYNDSARVATAHAERADRAQRQAQGDAVTVMRQIRSVQTEMPINPTVSVQ